MHWSSVGNIVAIAIGTGTVAAGALWGAWWVWWRLPKRQVDRLRLTIRDAKARADLEDNFRKTISQLLGGAAVLIAAGLAYLQFQQQQQASRELLISNQVAKGFEQLGSDKLVVRLGGIYALEGVMSTSVEYYRPILEALSAFIRDGTRTEQGDGPPATDIQAALTVIGRRDLLIETIGPDLTNAHIPKAVLEGAKLTGAHLDNANLAGANLVGANLTGATLNGANLNGAVLIDANLTGGSVNGATLTGAFLQGGNTNLTGAHLNGTDMTGADFEKRCLDPR